MNIFFFLALHAMPLAALVANLQEASLQAIVLINKETKLTEEECSQVWGIEVRNLDLPGSVEEISDLLAPFLEKKTISALDLKEIKRVVYLYYQKNGYPFILVEIDSTCCRNVLQVIVQESTLGELRVEGNKWTTPERYYRYMSAAKGQPISVKTFYKDLDFINRNPYRRVDVVYTPGREKNTTDVVLEVKDQIPYRFYMGFDNTGVPNTGRQRVFAGFSWNQVFGLDHNFFYQYTTNYNANRFHSNTFQYTAFLPWQAIMSLYGGYSVVHAHLPPPQRKNDGTNIQASLRYTTPLTPGVGFSHAITAGFDVKELSNVMQFVDYTPRFGHIVNLTQWSAEYQWKIERPSLLLEGGAACYISPWEWLPDQGNTDFSSLRPGAKNRWIYGVFDFHLNRPLDWGMSCDFYAKGELSSTPLLPSEQLGLGGFGSVRGYDERQFNADSGLQISIEWHSPSFLQNKARTSGGHFLLFLDSGFGCEYTFIPEVRHFEYLIGIGPGFRYHLSRYFQTRLDWGIKLHNQAHFTGGSNMVQFSVIGSY